MAKNAPKGRTTAPTKERAKTGVSRLVKRVKVPEHKMKDKYSRPTQTQKL